MRYAISIPQFHADGTFDPSAFRAYMHRAEELGFESAWTTEQIIGTMPDLGPIETMTYAAACTERIRLGCSMHILPLYSPLHLAKSLSTLDQLSRGRPCGLAARPRRPCAGRSAGRTDSSERARRTRRSSPSRWG